MKGLKLYAPPHLRAFIFLLTNLMLLLCRTAFRNQYAVHVQDEICFIISIYTSFTSQYSHMPIKAQPVTAGSAGAVEVSLLM